MRKIGFVSPWYGENISGGAEAEVRDLVRHLHQNGMKVEVLTTCVRSFRDDWNVDAHAPGISIEAEISVHRFPVRKRNTQLFDEVNGKLLRGERITEAEEGIFCREMINSPALYDYIREHGEEYTCFVFIPYMFGTTYYGSQIYPEKSILIPCLHDECYAHMKCFREAYSRVRGMIFNAEPERELAEKLYGVRGPLFRTMGIGMDTNWMPDPERFRQKYQIKSPFLLYAGRKEAGKKVDMLVRYFEAYQTRYPSDLRLILIGGGEISLNGAKHVVDLGFVSAQDKYDAYAAADVFCNPSEMESFSLVLMESWLAGRPVLVNGKCPVTKNFVREANGGLYFDNYWEFEAALNYLTANKDACQMMGKNGREYVTSHFSWPIMIQKYQSYFRDAALE